jgi:hypothetical protein
MARDYSSFYLVEYAAYTSASYVGEVILTYPAQRIAYFIGQRLEKDRSRVREKAEWFSALLEPKSGFTRCSA